MKHSFFDKYSEMNTLVHRLPAEAKILFFLFYALSLEFFPSKISYHYIVYILILVIYWVISKVPCLYVVKKLIVVIPFAGLVFVCNAFSKNFNNIIPSFFNSIFIVSLLILIINTTKFTSLLSGLKNLGVPKIILLLLSFSYRYFFVLTDEIEKLIISAKLRSCKNLSLKTLSSIVGMVFIKSYERAERVYLAMIARGYNGKIEVL